MREEEPTLRVRSGQAGALSLGALLTEPERFRDRAVCCVISGGNVDVEVYCRMLTADHE